MIVVNSFLKPLSIIMHLAQRVTDAVGHARFLAAEYLVVMSESISVNRQAHIEAFNSNLCASSRCKQTGLQ